MAVDDCGPVVNPAIVDGQLHGGIAQGIAQALYEEAVYDEDGNPITATLVGLHLPRRAGDAELHPRPDVTPVPDQPDGREGHRRVGGHSLPAGGHERGRSTHSRTSGVTHIDMPASPGKVWQAIQDAQGRADEAGSRDADLSGRPSQATEGDGDENV